MFIFVKFFDFMNLASPICPITSDSFIRLAGWTVAQIAVETGEYVFVTPSEIFSSLYAKLRDGPSEILEVSGSDQTRICSLLNSNAACRMASTSAFSEVENVILVKIATTAPILSNVVKNLSIRQLTGHLNRFSGIELKRPD